MDDVVRSGVRVRDPVFVGPPVGRIHHGGDVVDVLRHPRDVLGDVPGAFGGHAEHGGAETGAGGVHPLSARGEESDDRVLRAPVLAREAHP